MKKKSSANGFTMMEMLIAVAILVILMSIGFVAVQNHQRSMKQLELDGTAKEIYIAAQNHLTMAASMGILENYTLTSSSMSEEDQAKNNEKVGITRTYEWDSKERTSNFIIVSPTDDGPDSKLTSGTVLNEMLPKLSIDDTVRVGGSYIIEYDLKSAQVLSVFYCDLSSLSDHKFEPSDFPNLYPGYYGSENAEKRREGYGTNKAILGWYGGDDLQGVESAKLFPPEIQVTNAELLEVKVSVASNVVREISKYEGTNARLQVVIEGMTSANKRIVNLYDGKDDLLNDFASTATPEIKNGVQYMTRSYPLDDVTTPGYHFAERWCTGDEPLIPGENVKLYAVIYSNSVLSNIAKSSEKVTNSLFASVDDYDLTTEAERELGLPSNIVKRASVSNFRHLENIDSSTSGYTTASFVDKNGNQIGPTRFVQVNDLRWRGDGTGMPKDASGKPLSFTDQIKANKLTSYNKAEDVKVYRKGEISSGGTKAGKYLPVSPSYGITYEGAEHKITNVMVEIAGSAGIFGELISGSSVSELELIDCNIESTTVNVGAGALVGQASGKVTISSTLVHDSASVVQPAITSKGAAGGLVGIAKGGDNSANVLMIDKCASAVLVKTDGPGTIAGGLVGYSEGYIAITESYTGGHTENGVYNVSARNVMADGLNTAAGGLIGHARGSMSLADCYSTCSVGATSVAGGLVGQMTGGSIVRSYATGLVSGSATSKGAFAGILGTNVTQSAADNNKFYSIINEDMAAVGNDKSTGVSAFDETAATFNTFAAGGLAKEAKPYDTTLTTYYQDKYPFKTVNTLFGKNHYGDWPAMETLVVNTPTSSS